MNRPRKLIVIAGTGTEVGKTWVGCELLSLARRRGLTVSARKPAQSFDPGQTTDADQLAVATGEASREICPEHRWYPVAMAPPMAADVLERERLLLSDLLAEMRWAHDLDWGCVEIAGGLRSPITHDADNVELIERLAPDVVVLVADAGLGTINSVRMSVAALGGTRVYVHLNRFDADDDLHVRNRRWLNDVYNLQASVTVEELFDRVSPR